MWQASLLPRCLPNFRAIGKVSSQIPRFRDFLKSDGKTSVRLVNRDPDLDAAPTISDIHQVGTTNQYDTKSSDDTFPNSHVDGYTIYRHDRRSIIGFDGVVVYIRFDLCAPFVNAISMLFNLHAWNLLLIQTKYCSIYLQASVYKQVHNCHKNDNMADTPFIISWWLFCYPGYLTKISDVIITY